jgi:hypothetical protein
MQEKLIEKNARSDNFIFTQKNKTFIRIFGTIL